MAAASAPGCIFHIIELIVGACSERVSCLHPIENAERRGIEIGEKRGEERGERKKQLEIAKRLKDEGVNVDTICKTTGLTIEEVEKL